MMTNLTVGLMTKKCLISSVSRVSPSFNDATTFGVPRSRLKLSVLPDQTVGLTEEMSSYKTDCKRNCEIFQTFSIQP